MVLSELLALGVVTLGVIICSIIIAHFVVKCAIIISL
jgi:hypothetical protein